MDITAAIEKHVLANLTFAELEDTPENRLTVYKQLHKNLARGKIDHDANLKLLEIEAQVARIEGAGY
jgi:hypothetical protein